MICTVQPSWECAIGKEMEMINIDAFKGKIDKHTREKDTEGCV